MSKKSSTKPAPAVAKPAAPSKVKDAKPKTETKIQKSSQPAKKTTPPAKKPAPRKKAIKKTPKFYPAERLPKPKVSRAAKSPAVGKLRSTITPGTILIIVAGRHQGKRVVFLKQLASGLLLVTGPHYLNRVPLRRVNQAYVIATSTKVDLPFTVDPKFDDMYFRRMLKKTKRSKEATFFSRHKDAKKYNLTQERRLDQARMDQLLRPVVRKVPELSTYLKGRFTLTHGQFPHLMQF